MVGGRSLAIWCLLLLHQHQRGAVDASSITTTLLYGHEDGARPFFYAYERSPAEVKASLHEADAGGSMRFIEVDIEDARGEGLQLTLDGAGFELVEHQTALATEDFYSSPEKVRKVYYEEMSEAIKEATGASHVKVFHHQVRNRERARGDGKDLFASVQGYQAGIHSDTHSVSAEELFQQLSVGEEERAVARGRFMYINGWRNIADTPIEDDNLGVCDETSLTAPDDYIATDLFLPTGPLLQYRLSDRNSAQHRWYYYSAMTKNELLLFKQWDSDQTKPARTCFHTSFSDPGASPRAPARQSIEVRALAYFPDHEPNTCPRLEDKTMAGAEGEGSPETIQKAAVNKVQFAISALSFWPDAGVKWLQSEFQTKGARAVAERLVEDPENRQGLKNIDKETKVSGAVM
ncbi:unnamed protein product [Chrysoparadoxa australica]